MTTLLPEVLPSARPPTSAVLTESPVTSPPTAAHAASPAAHASFNVDVERIEADVPSGGAADAVHRSAEAARTTTGRIATPTPQLAICRTRPTASSPAVRRY